jgi:RNA polymerase sigma-70 factor (ECF subfamily)
MQNIGSLSDASVLSLPLEQHRDVDSALVHAAATGATGAIGDLYQRHSRRVYSLCLRMTRNVDEAEDLTQDVFIQLLRKIGSFRGESHFSTWLYRLTVNQVLMHFRRTKRRREAPDEIQLVHAIRRKSKCTTGLPVVDRMTLNAALAKLPPGCRAVFVLFSVEGYKHEEIAKLFGCSVGNSKSQLHKARKKLKRLLTEYAGNTRTNWSAASHNLRTPIRRMGSIP